MKIQTVKQQLQTGVLIGHLQLYIFFFCYSLRILYTMDHDGKKATFLLCIHVFVLGSTSAS